MDYHWFRWTLRWNRRLKKKRFLVEFIMMPGGDVCTCCSLSLNQPIRARESRFVAENQWSDWPLQIQLPNRVIDTEYSNIRPRIFDLVLSNPNQSLWTFVKPESRLWETNIRNSLHWFLVGRLRHRCGESHITDRGITGLSIYKRFFLPRR